MSVDTVLGWIASTTELELILGGLVFVGSVVGFAWWSSRGEMQQRDIDAREAMARGAVVTDETIQKGAGLFLRTWNFLDVPADFSLRATSVSEMALNLSSDVKLGSATFQGHFHVATSDPEAAKEVLGEDGWKQLLSLKDCEFLIGSFHSLHLFAPDDAWGERDRDERSVWMVKVRKSEHVGKEARERVIQIGTQLGEKVSAAARARSERGGSTRTGYAEGRWY